MFTPPKFERIMETDSKQPIVPWLSPSFAAVDSHGYFFSPDGSKAISARYWFDAISVGVIEFKKGSNVPQDVAEVFLENDDGTYGATTHYAYWVNNR